MSAEKGVQKIKIINFQIKNLNLTIFHEKLGPKIKKKNITLDTILF